MGLFGSIKAEAQRNFIARPLDAKDDILFLYPENNVRVGTQLTIGADEVVLFVKGGRVQGTLTSQGSPHTLDTSNIPFLSALLEKATGGNLFVAQVYFVSIREFPNVKFGGPIGDVRDPETGLGIGTMVYGDFSVQVKDAEKLLLGLAGLRSQSNAELLEWFKSQVLKVTRDRIAELLVKKNWPLLNVTSGAYTEEIETEVLAGLRPHVDGYGMSIVRMGNFHIAIKEEDEATLKKLSKDVAYSRLAGGFQQYAQGQMMLGASEGMAKGGGGGEGGTMQGLGMGMGFGMASQMMQQMGRNSPQGTPPATPGSGQAGAGGTQASAGTVCPSCGIRSEGRFCSNCGKALAATRQCASCKAELSATTKFCPNCGEQAA